MGTPYLSEIRIVSFNFAPKGWALCNGQFLPINQNQALFSLLGTTYGGNGQTTFALPNLQGRLPLSFGDGLTLGQAGGEIAHTVTQGEMPSHFHPINASNAPAASQAAVLPPTNAYFAQAYAVPAGGGSTPVANYSATLGSAVTMNPAMITNTGGSQAHQNMMPYLTLNFIIALQGIFPSQN